MTRHQQDISRIQITTYQEEYAIKTLFYPESKERDKGQVRLDTANFLETIAKGLRTGRKPDTDGGQSGFWKDGRVEEMVVDRRGRSFR